MRSSARLRQLWASSTWEDCEQLTRLVGPAIAAEYMLSAAQVPASEAARVGWVNSAYSTEDELKKHVDDLATRIARFHIEALQATKASIAEQAAPRTAFNNDLDRFNRT